MKKSVLLLLIATLGVQVVAKDLERRPDQFVLISFDGSKSHGFWQESLDIAKKANARFSYFISGVYFLQGSQRNKYQGPRHKAGKSDIGFAKDGATDINKRVGYVWQALENEFDIGSHVNGHFDGGAWNKAEWTSEFDQFHNLVAGVFENNPGVKASFSPQWYDTLNTSLVGFRAPLLAENIATQQVLKEFKYLYDASGQDKNKWPSQKDTGVWDLPLTRIQLAGTKRETVAMDYNVFYGQCNGKFAPKGQECVGLTPNLMRHFEEQVYISYINSFLKSYYGNRAPFSIGHHFSLWNRGVYWRALQRVIYAICSQPETRCITHKDMVGWMQKTIEENGGNSKAVLAKLNQGAFPKNGIPPSVKRDLKVDESILNKVADSDELIPEIQEPAAEVMLKGDLPGAHLDEFSDGDLDGVRVQP